jgi:chorismate dehydratase
MAHLRVGSVPYLVGRPLDGGLDREPGIELSHDVPARLIERLRAGEIDVALVSSIELFREPGYRYLDGLAVAGRDHVGSVQLFLEGERTIDQVRHVALDPASRTARTLARVLLAGQPGGGPEFREVPAGQDPRAQGCDAWLRIGDAALREHLLEKLPSWNPSQAWARETGLPFVFAPWIVRPGVDLAPHGGAFLRAAERGQAALESLAVEAARAWGLPASGCRRYLTRECVYHLSEDEQARSLRAFRDRAAGLGLCRADLDPQPISLGELHA